MKQLAWVAVLVAAGVPGRADADCGIPRWIGAPDTSTLPVRGSIYVHHEMMRLDEGPAVPPTPTITWTGAASTVSVGAVGDVVYRIDYDAPHASGANISADQHDDWHSTNVTFDPAWTAPQSAPRVVQYWHNVYAWTCSSSDSVKIQLDQSVAAVRVRWTYDGHTGEFIEVPRSNKPTRSVIEIGKINCGSTTIDPEQLAAGGHLELIAIRADRTEVPVTGLPEILTTKEMPTDDGDRAMHLQSLLPAEPAVAEAKVAEEAPGSLLGMIVLGMFALGGLLAFRLRVRAPDYLR